jgi:hypothetical protein
MTRRVHSVPPGERKETAKAAASFAAYRDLGPGRSLSKLHEKFLQQAAESRQSGGKSPMPPTTSFKMLAEWCTAFHWTARVAAWEAEVDYARRAEALRQAEAQARQNAQLLQQVGQGALGVAALALNRYVNSETGELTEPLEARDLPRLMDAGATLLQLATHSPTTIVQTQDSTQLERILREAPDDVRTVVLRGLRAALDWQERSGGAS